MTTRVTELAASITGDARELLAELEKIKGKSREVGTASKAASQESEQGLSKLATSSKKAANAVGNTVDALADLEKRGAAAFTDLSRQGAEFAALLGPTGAIVGATAIATIAIVNIFLRARRELKQLAAEFQTELRGLERSQDVSGLNKRTVGLFSGDRLFGDKNSDEEKTDATKRRVNAAIRGNEELDPKKFVGGIEFVKQNIDELKVKLKAVRPSLDEGGVAIQRFNERQAALGKQLREAKETLAILNEQYGESRAALDRVTEATVKTNTEGLKQEQAEAARQKALQLSKEKANALGSALKSLTDLTRSLRAQLDEDASGETSVAKILDDTERAGIPLRNVVAELARLNEIAGKGSDANGLPVTAKAKAADAAIKRLTKTYGPYLDQLNEAQKTLEETDNKAANEKGTKALAAGLDKLGDAQVKVSQLTEKEAEALDRLTRERRASVADLQAEQQALALGTVAYEEYLKQKFIAAEIDKERKALGREFGEGEETAATIRAEALFNKVKAATDGIAKLRAAANDGLVSQFAQLAEYATTIATSLGEGGRGLARAAAIIGPLLKGVDGIRDATQKRDAKGGIVRGAGGAAETVSLFTALKGGNGKDAQAKAIASSVAIIGAVAGIADALDLFGTRAKAEARAMQEAARAFDLALKDFVASANPQTGAAEGIRQARRQAEELAKQAASVNGYRGAGARPFTGDVTAQALRARADEIRRDADTFTGVSAAVGDSLRRVAGRFKEVASSLAQVEQAQREQVLRNIEDVGVRKLIAAGLTEEAEARRIQLEQDRAITAATKDDTEEGKRYLAVLQDLFAAENAAAAATQRRVELLERLDTDNAILGGDAITQLSRTIVTLKDLFPQFGALFDDLDLSTTAGLQAFAARLRDAYAELAKDGISDAEQPLVDAIRRGLTGIDAALGALGAGITDAMDLFAIRVEVFGLNAKEQFDELVNIFGGKFTELDAILTDPALKGADNLGALKATLQSKIAALLEGGVTAEEAPLLAALRQLLGNVNEQLDAATQAALDAAAEAEATATAARAGRRTDASTRVDLFGLEGGEAFLETVRGYSGAFASLFNTFDPTSLVDIDNAQGLLRGIFTDIASLTDEEVFAKFGMTRDELIAALLDTNSGLNSLKGALGDVTANALEAAQATADFAESLLNDFLRSQGNDKQADINEATAKRDDRLRQAKELGLGQADIDKINAIFAKDLRDIDAKYAAIVQSAAEGGGSAGGDGAGTGSGGGASRGNSRVVDDLGNLTSIEAQTLADRLRQIEYNTSGRGDLAALLADLRPPTNIPLPAFSTLSAGRREGGGSLTVGSITITIGALNPQGATPRVAAQTVVGEVLRALGRGAEGEIRFLGGAKR